MKFIMWKIKLYIISYRYPTIEQYCILEQFNSNVMMIIDFSSMLVNKKIFIERYFHHAIFIKLIVIEQNDNFFLYN